MTKTTRNIIIAILIIFIIGIAIYFLVFSKKQEVPIISSPIPTLAPSSSPTLILKPIVGTPLTQENYPVDYDVTQSDVNFLVSAVDNNSLVLKYIIPKIKSGQQITSKISCLPQDIKMIYEPMNLSSEQKNQLNEEMDQTMERMFQEDLNFSTFEELTELIEQQEEAILLKYGYRIEYPNNLNDFLNRIQLALNQSKTIHFLGKCLDSSCLEINQDCRISINN